MGDRWTEADLVRRLRTTQTQLAEPEQAACTRRCSLILPWPPSLSNYRMVANNRIIMTHAGKDYHRAVAFAVAQQRRGQPPYHHRLHLEVDYHAPYPDPESYDIDNFCKALFDALTHARVYSDDKQIFCWRSSKRAYSEPGYVVVLIDLCRDKPCCGDIA